MRPCALAGNFRFSQPNVPRTIKTLSNIEIKDAAISVPRGPFGQKNGARLLTGRSILANAFEWSIKYRTH
jgi:hypothetical protein